MAVTAVVALIPESRSSVQPTIDYLGIVISSAALAALVYGVMLAGEKGWSNGWAIAFVVAAVVLLAIFAVVEGRFGRTGTPLIGARLLRQAPATAEILGA